MNKIQDFWKKELLMLTAISTVFTVVVFVFTIKKLDKPVLQVIPLTSAVIDDNDRHCNSDFCIKGDIKEGDCVVIDSNGVPIAAGRLIHDSVCNQDFLLRPT